MTKIFDIEEHSKAKCGVKLANLCFRVRTICQRLLSGETPVRLHVIILATGPNGGYPGGRIVKCVY